MYSATKISLFIVNYGKELRIRENIRKKRKSRKINEICKKNKEILVKEWKKKDKIMLSIKDLVFKKKLVRKLLDQYINQYIINKIVFTNTVKLRLLTLIRVHLVINIS